ncbi:MAG TPA: recombinase family protein [Thermoanaerobaculia bacterium]|nr:recombinase family protein [Thermoanaerobaculia bacterium]
MIALYLLVVEGVESIEPTLSRVRDLAAHREICIDQEIVELVRSLASRRPRLDQLLARVRAGEVSGIVGSQLSDWFRSTPAAAAALSEWFDQGLIVYTLDGIASDLAGRAEISAALQWWHRQQDLRASRSIRAGIARRRQGRSTWGRGHARVPVSEREIVELAERGLSTAEIARTLAKRRVAVGRETVRKHVNDLLAGGRVDLTKRATAIAERGGAPKGGRRPRKRVKG